MKNQPISTEKHPRTVSFFTLPNWYEKIRYLILGHFADIATLEAAQLLLQGRSN